MQPFADVLELDIEPRPADVYEQMRNMGETVGEFGNTFCAHVTEACRLIETRAVIRKEPINPGATSGTIQVGRTSLNLTDEGVKYCLYPCDGFFYVTTLGSRISDRVNDLRGSDSERARIYAHTGIMAIGLARCKVRDMVEAEAKRLNMRVGPIMQPGSLRCWDVSEQAKILEIADAGTLLNLRITESGWVDPQYSNTGFIPIGPHYKRDFAYSLCHQCPLTDCFFREETKDIEDI